MTHFIIKLLSSLIFVLLPGYNLKDSFKNYPILSPLSIIFGLILLFFSIQPLFYDGHKNNKSQKITEYYKIRNRQVGIFTIGEHIPFPTASDTYTIRETKHTRLTEEGTTEEIMYIVNENSIDILLLQVDESNLINEITIISDLIRTNNNIGINSSIEDFINTYKDYNIWYTRVSDMYVIENKKINIQFLLKKQDFIGKVKINGDTTKLKVSDFKKETKIFKIRIF